MSNYNFLDDNMKVPVKDILCPYCFNLIHNDEVYYQCESTEKDFNGDYCCPRESTPEYDDYWRGEDLLHRHIIPRRPEKRFLGLCGINLDRINCDRCGYPSRRFVCPCCHNWLPALMIEKGADIISVIGGPSSGKTNYIIALINQVRQIGYRINLNMVPQQVYREGRPKESTSEIFNALETQLFRERTLLDKTRQTNTHPTPLIFALTNNATQHTVYLVFYDTAGEDFKTVENIKANANYLRHSKAAIVLFDTLSIDAVKQEVAKNDATASAIDFESKVSFNDTMDTLFNLIDNNRLDLDKKPFAFVFSKFDLVTANMGAWTGVNLQDLAQNSSYLNTGRVDFGRINDNSYNIELLMGGRDRRGGFLEQNWGQGHIIAQVQGRWRHHDKKNPNDPLARDPNLDNYKFFGVSSFGCNPVDGMLPSVKPLRVMDPLVWILHRLGGFDIPTT